MIPSKSLAAADDLGAGDADELDADDATVPGEKRSRRDAGFVLAWLALMLVTLVGFAGFAVDVGHWYLTASRVQNAADAGALAGVVFLPGEFPTGQDVATDVGNGHGYADAEIVVTPGDHPNQLRVTISHEVDNFFVSLFGINSTTLTRSALAEFEGPVPMGSPENYLGNDPERGELSDHWMNAGSTTNNAVNGDRYNNGICPGGNVLGPCNATAPTNPSFNQNGTFYAIESDGTGPLVIQVFDPAFYEVGDTCTQSQTSIFNVDQAALIALAGSTPSIPNNWHDDAAARYVGGASQEWCTGDWIAGASRSAEGPVDTSYIVRSPDTTPWLDDDNPVINTSTCSPQQFEGFDYNWMAAGGGLQGRLSDTGIAGEGQVNPPGGGQTLANSFRRWVTVCEITNPVAGTYVLQVRTNAALGSPTVANNTLNTFGHNRYSIRAGVGSDPTAGTWSSGVQMYANGRMPIYVNATGANTEFFLARVTPSGTQRVLNVSLWDISDGGSSGSMQIVPPPDANVSNFSGCDFGSSGGSYTPNAGNCSFSFNAGALNGQLMQVEVPLPDGYTCNVGSPTGCWITVKAPFSGSVNDTTTWSASLVGDPVRLIE